MAVFRNKRDRDNLRNIGFLRRTDMAGRLSLYCPKFRVGDLESNESGQFVFYLSGVCNAPL